MKFRILGPLEVLDEERPVTLGGARQRALLALLVLHANEALSTERLIDELWGEHPPATAVKAVQVHVSRLRRALEGTAGNGSAGVVVTRDRGYELRTDPESVDSKRFERLVIEGRSELVARRPERAAAVLEAALSLWRGPPLADLAYEQFAQAEIARLSDLRVAALEELVEAKLALGRHAEVSGALEPLIAEHPYRERLRAQLMLALYRCERQADALQAYQDARRTLVDELGIEPGERLRELERAILAQDPALAHTADGQAAAEPAAEPARSAFVGREPELAELVERSRELSVLGDSLDAIHDGSHGRLMLVAGEAGIGKTALVQRFCAEQAESARIFWGACDPLFTPRPLGPLVEIAQSTGDELEELVGNGARPHEVVAALVRELRLRKPTIVVLEDMHWADEGTLDVLRLLRRRVEAVPALVLATYRDDELDHAHPLRFVLGEFASGQEVGRLKLAPLSPTAVKQLADPYGVDPDELHHRTAGNPFFVTEVLAAGEQREIPQTVRDAVFARAARLGPAARTLLEAVAMVPPQAELWLLRALAGEVIEALEECLTSGMLEPVPDGVAFRHELARLAIEDSVPPDRRTSLHQRAVAALAEPTAGAPDLARLAHHADGAGDTDAVLRFAPPAAARAASLGAHREAAAHYHRALRFADRLPTTARAELLESYSRECYVTDQSEEAIEALKRAIGVHHELDDGRKEGVALCSLSQILWCPGRTTESERAARDAVALLERLPPGRELALAYSVLSQFYMNAEDSEAALGWAKRAIELAERLDDTEIAIHSSINRGTVEFLSEAPEGLERLERSIELARHAGLDAEAARATANLVWAAARQRSYAVADRYLESGLKYANERGLELWRVYLLTYRAGCELDRGRWQDAVDTAAQVLRARLPSTLPRAVALAITGLVCARRGDPDPWPLLDDALALSEPTGELQRMAPVAAARAEAAWLQGRPDAIAEATDATFELALRRKAAWVIGQLAHWRSRAGLLEETPPGAAEPYAAQIRGDWPRAAELWTEIGCPYEAALALADADDESTLLRALDTLQGLGAPPAAAIVARRLRERGAMGLPRRPEAVRFGARSEDR